MNNDAKTSNETADRRVSVQPEDRPKLDRITAVKGWTYTTAMSRLLDHFIATDPQMQADAAQTTIPAPTGQHLDATG